MTRDEFIVQTVSRGIAMHAKSIVATVEACRSFYGEYPHLFAAAPEPEEKVDLFDDGPPIPTPPPAETPEGGTEGVIAHLGMDDPFPIGKCRGITPRQYIERFPEARKTNPKENYIDWSRREGVFVYSKEVITAWEAVKKDLGVA
jgi:hypothetical protein